MQLLCPDAYLLAYRNPKATFECLRSFRQFHPTSMIELVSDGGGDDLADIARYFGCQYRRAEEHAGGRRKTPERMRDWLHWFADAAAKCRGEHIMLLEDDVLIRGPIRCASRIAVAGPYRSYARLSPRLMEHLRRRQPHPTSDHYGGCGGSLFHRESLLEAAGAFRFEDFEYFQTLEPRICYGDVFLTMIFLLRGFAYSSLEDVYCEATGAYPEWKTNGRPIVHQYKEFYGRALSPEDLALLQTKQCDQGVTNRF
jgi:hypothetical protein